MASATTARNGQETGSQSNSPAELAESCNRFEELLPKIDCRAELLRRAAEHLQENTATFITKIVLSENGVEPEFEVVASQFDQAPVHLQKWAFSTATKAASTNKSVVETAVDQMGFQVHMVGVMLSKSAAEIEILAVLFSQGSTDGTLEVLFLSSFVRAIRGWDALQENKEFVHLAEDTAALLELRSKLEQAESVQECCSQIANELSHYADGLLGDQQTIVYAANVDSQGVASLVTVSGSDALPQDVELVEALESAFGECLCRNMVTVWPAESSERHAMLCHQRLADLLQCQYLQTVPLHDSQGEIVGVVTLSSKKVIDGRVQRLLSSTAQPFGSTLELVNRAQQNHLQKLINRARESWKTGKTRLVLKCLAAILVVGLIPLPYQVSTDCELQPLERRYVCAPFNAQLGECSVEPGDIVVKDQVLATLDDREVRMELAQIEADYHRAAKKRDGLVAAHESGEARLADLEADGLKARNDLLLHRAENLRLKSPISGMVIEGDHQDNEGMPLETGQSLFQIAPLDLLNVELFVPEADVRYVRPGMSVSIRLQAFPFESWDGIIKNIQPAAEIHNEDSVFVATVQIQNLDGKLRPGMTGNSKISSVWRPIAWNWLHQPVARCLRWVGW